MREWLKKIREKEKMTQVQVAKLAGIAESYYSMIETGDRRPSVEVAQAIAAILHFDWQLFFPNKNDSAPQLNTA